MSSSLRPASGFTLIEVLITAFVLGVVTVTLTGLSLVITRSAIENERQEVAINLATEKLENLQAAFQARGYEVVDFKDTNPAGFVEREEIVTRNNLDYTVKAFIHSIDDPANGVGQADFKTVLYKVTWQSNLGQADLENVVQVAASALTFSPHSSFAQSQESSVSLGVAVYSEAQQKDDSCHPGTLTCPQTDCTPNSPASCPDAQGELTLSCPFDGICPGSGTEPYALCPASGKCSDVGQVPPPEAPQPGPQCPNGIQTIGNTDEICNFGAVCRDFIDNDQDNGTDTGPGNPLADKQCNDAAANVQHFGKEALFELLRVDDASCMGEYAEIGTVSTFGQCTVTLNCGYVRRFWQAVPGCVPQTGDCRVDRGCPPNSTCRVPNADPEKQCPQNQPKCSEDIGGRCFECLSEKIIDENGDNGTSECKNIVEGFCDGSKSGECVCRSGLCAQCEQINKRDLEHCPQDKKPFCSVGACVVGTPDCRSKQRAQCVECLQDSDCPREGQSKLASRCRTAFYPSEQKNTCQTQCNDGIDNDGDGTVDTEGLDVNGDGVLEKSPDFSCVSGSPTEQSVCSNGLDDDNDGFIDFPNDPQCAHPDDTDEGGAAECSDTVDNDVDGFIDFPNDPQCDSALDPFEGDFHPPTPEPVAL